MNDFVKAHRHINAIKCHTICLKQWSSGIVENNNKAINKKYIHKTMNNLIISSIYYA